MPSPKHVAASTRSRAEYDAERHNRGKLARLLRVLSDGREYTLTDLALAPGLEGVPVVCLRTYICRLRQAGYPILTLFGRTHAYRLALADGAAPRPSAAE